MIKRGSEFLKKGDLLHKFRRELIKMLRRSVKNKTLIKLKMEQIPTNTVNVPLANKAISY